MVLLRLSLAKERVPSYAELAAELGITASEVHAAIERAHAALYELLALFDALRAGAARERKMASDLLAERLE